MPKPLYDHRHNQARQHWATIVKTGRATCSEPICLHPTRRITPGEPWDLAHDRTTGHYRGPAHRRCNRSEGATHGNTHRTPTTTHNPSRTW